MLFHSWLPELNGLLPRAYLGVDLFFVLSGFVIAHAYESRLGTARQLGEFCIARLIRLYPLYCVAVLMTAGVMLFYSIAGANGAPPPELIISSFLPRLLFLPVPPSWSIRPALMFPLVVTSWSLFWELWVNLLYAVVAPKLRWWALAAIMLLGALGVGLALHTYGDLGGGWRWQDAWTAAARALFSFFAGVAVFRWRGIRRAPGVPSWFLAALLVLSFTPAKGGWAYDGFCAFLLFPAIVWFAADAAQGATMRSIGLFAGYLSYPVYLMQIPERLAIAPVMARLSRVVPSEVTLGLLLYVGSTLLLSWVVADWFDSPVREWLRRRFARRSPAPAAQTAP